MDIRENFEKAVSALKNRFDDQAIRASSHMQLRSQKTRSYAVRRSLLFFVRKIVFKAKYK